MEIFEEGSVETSRALNIEWLSIQVCRGVEIVQRVNRYKFDVDTPPSQK